MLESKPLPSSIIDSLSLDYYILLILHLSQLALTIASTARWPRSFASSMSTGTTASSSSFLLTRRSCPSRTPPSVSAPRTLPSPLTARKLDGKMKLEWSPWRGSKYNLLLTKRAHYHYATEAKLLTLVLLFSSKKYNIKQYYRRATVGERG